MKTADGQFCGRIKDVYFEDLSWQLRHLVLSIEPSPFGRKQVLLSPGQVECLSQSESWVHLKPTAAEVAGLPPASSVLPVCKQYAAFAVSPRGAGLFGGDARGSDPHLRSFRSVMTCRVEGPGDFAGTVADMLVDDSGWGIRYLAVEQSFENKKLNFHVLPQSIERISWAAQRVILRELEPVAIAWGELPLEFAPDTAGGTAA